MSKPKYTQHYAVAEVMPPLSHWPDRAVEFSFERSDVNRWLAGNLKVNLFKAEMIRSNLASKKILVFDHEAKLWSGKNYQPTS